MLKLVDDESSDIISAGRNPSKGESLGDRILKTQFRMNLSPAAESSLKIRITLVMIVYLTFSADADS